MLTDCTRKGCEEFGEAAFQATSLDLSMKDAYDGKIITEYNEFVKIVEDVGFMPLSSNCLGYINLSGLTREDQWHTDLPSDPWPWRVEIETDHKAAFAKLFDKKPGFISLEWYPVFIAARRKQRSFEDMYQDGIMSSQAKQIYTLFEKYNVLATHEIKALCGFTKESAAKYEAAMAELQMNMLLTTSGMKRKIAASGEPYGWPATAYSTVETWAGEELFETAMQIKPKHAIEQIMEQIHDLVPDADQRKVRRFAGI